MGHLMSAMSGMLGSKEVRILLLGLDNAGKTTLLYKLKLNQCVNTLPTVGFNVEDVQYRNIKFRMWDVGGQVSLLSQVCFLSGVQSHDECLQDKIRALWRYYFQGCQAIIYMVDSADHGRLVEAGNVLTGLLEDDLLCNTTVLVYANKQVSLTAKTRRTMYHTK